MIEHVKVEKFGIPLRDRVCDDYYYEVGVGAYFNLLVTLLIKFY